MASVTVITATTGRKSLLRCVQSVQDQVGYIGKVQHLVMVDGPESSEKMFQYIPYDKISGRDKYSLYHNVELVELPYSVGKDRWNGHRMYAAGTFLADGDYVMYLDDDNWLDETHIQECLQAIIDTRLQWAYSLRKIVSEDGKFLCNDDCESLGRHHTVLGPQDYLVDVNCYFFKKDLAVQLAPVWNRKAREPGVMEVDRALCSILLTNQVPGAETGNYTLNYAVGGNALSVAPEFFIQGNKKMEEIYRGNFPWRKK
jgi:hypothetical protein